MKTIAHTMATIAETFGNYSTYVFYASIMLIVILFYIDIFMYSNLLKKRALYKSQLKVYKAIGKLYWENTYEINKEIEDINRKYTDAIEEINNKIKSYKGIGKYIFALFEVQ